MGFLQRGMFGVFMVIKVLIAVASCSENLPISSRPSALNNGCSIRGGRVLGFMGLDTKQKKSLKTRKNNIGHAYVIFMKIYVFSKFTVRAWPTLFLLFFFVLCLRPHPRPRMSSIFDKYRIHPVLGWARRPKNKKN